MDSDDDIPIGKRTGKKRSVPQSESEDLPVNRAHRKASLASREGIKRGVRSDSDSDNVSDEEMASGSGESNSSGSDGSDSAESGEEDTRKRVVRKVVKKAAPAKAASAKKKAATPKAKPKASASKASGKKSVVESESESDQEGETSNKNEVKVLKQVQNRGLKEQLVADILCRWWYVLPDWPPANFDYAPVLVAKGLRLVPLDRWEDEPDLDKAGNMKCYALTQFQGLFRDATGGLRDLRPLEGKPCFSQLIHKSDKELNALLSAALTKQMEVLSSSSEKGTGASLADLKDRLRNVGKKR